VGFGDEVMAAGHAERVAKEKGPVTILDRHGQPRWHEVWENNPHIVKTGGHPIKNAAGCRPYIKYPWGEVQRFTDWRARDNIGHIYLTEDERVPKGDFFVINPTIKAKANRNKDWGFAKYQEVVNRTGLRFVQLSGPWLEGVERRPTATFREACAMLDASLGYVGAEGGLHHAAAALRKPAVVLVGSAVPVETLCYPTHWSLAHGKPCGSWRPCKHCRENMDKITVDDVIGAIKEMECSIKNGL
jgi:ADP-heptose:LPS heptosyltransferase